MQCFDKLSTNGIFFKARTLTERPAPSSGLKIAVEYGPLLVFLAVTFFAPDALVRQLVAMATISLSDLPRLEALVIARVIVATAAFMVATAIAMAVSKAKLGKISPMLLISGVLVVVFGGLTLWFRDPHFIKMKPTFVYALFAGLLGFGMITGRPLLQTLLGAVYEGLDADGWRKLTRNWAIFFTVMALMNELVWRWSEAVMAPEAALRVWTLYKMPGCVILTFVFALANVPMLMRHGLQLDEKTAATEQLPPE